LTTQPDLNRKIKKGVATTASAPTNSPRLPSSWDISINDTTFLLYLLGGSYINRVISVAMPLVAISGSHPPRC
jgi:hypothetical protein